MNDLLLIGTAIFFIGTMFYIVKIVSDTKDKKRV